MLEVLVHIDRLDVPSTFRLMRIEVPDNAPSVDVHPDSLSSDWTTDLSETRRIGTDLLARAEHLLIRVPTVLIPEARNVLLNPRHSDADRCRVEKTIDARFDKRLIF